MGVGRIRAGSAGDPTKLKRELKESAGSDKWFMTIPADSEVTVRFLAEPWEFVSYMKHYIGEGKEGKQFPCNEGDCIGCDEGSEPYKVWVAPVVEIEDGKPTRARAMVVPKSIVDTLSRKADKGPGTVMDRDYIIQREGSGKDNTKYLLDFEARKRRDLSEFEAPDIMEMLEQQLDDVLESDLIDDEPPRRGGRPTKKATKKAMPARRRTHDEDEDDEDEDDDEAPWDDAPPARSSTGAARKRPIKKAARPLKKAVAPKKSLRRR